MRRVYRRALLSVAFAFLCGCGSCSSDDDFRITIDDDGFGGNPLFNGVTCETADSSWSCSAPDGTSLDFAIYLVTFRGIARMLPATGSPTDVTFSWMQPRPDRVELTTDDGVDLIADHVQGSLNTRFLTFTLSGDDEPARSYDCNLADTILDGNCDEAIDPPTPLPSATPPPTATSMPTETPGNGEA